MDGLPANRSWQPSCSHGTYKHEAITSRSRQLLMMGTWLPETCWATSKGEIKNTKVTSSYLLLIDTELRCTVNLTPELRFCARSWRRFLYLLLFELLIRSFTVFIVSYIIESLNNVLKNVVQFRVLCTNCTVSNTCILILKVDTKLSNSGESCLLLLPTLTLWGYQNMIFVNVFGLFLMLCLYNAAHLLRKFLEVNVKKICLITF